MPERAVYAVATMDTKGEEITYVAGCARQLGVDVVVCDVGTQGPPTVEPDIAREAIAACHPEGADAALGFSDRGEAVTAMSRALAAFLQQELAAGKLGGVIGIGGSGGTALVSYAMRALPIGLPKLLVSTVASGNTKPYVECCDITMMYSVVDVAGLNRVSKTVLGNAAHAIAGMARNAKDASGERPALGMTMFGVTTPCVTEVSRLLEAKGYECLIFHATGTGGQAMEKLVESDMIGGVLDITTTEVCDEVVGGVLTAGPDRIDVILEKQVPYVVSLGALDMVNFGARDTVPPQFADRLLHVHNEQVTLMRTTADECREIARWIVGKLNRSTAPVIVLIPEQGVSMIDAEGQVFHDEAADAALFEEFERELRQTPTRQLRRLPLHVNDPEFAAALVEAYEEVQAMAAQA
ncbi:MAG: UPF0261 family protein [Planctomycetota bacterium]|nr:MAG: UPF0261 family protein [Planctomycetota bacterium]REJ94403.1 MAG: UPF0261 family protein [Planctomycetota bacterium]REK22064.1 MAG: UPF0261 family protein [Planctomycetota bacterium]REK44472.1 MAG: UPF0261 family protein [Planctomycetota bacterium]